MKTIEFYTEKEISPIFGRIWKPYIEGKVVFKELIY